MSAVARAPVQSLIPLLVVSLDDVDYSSLRRILERDCLLHRAAGRQEALSLVRSCRPRAVICDQVLADGDWRDLLADLQGEPEVPPLIVASYLADDRLWEEVLNLGGYDLLMKPFPGMEVSRVVGLAAHPGAWNPHPHRDPNDRQCPAPPSEVARSLEEGGQPTNGARGTIIAK